MSTETASTVFVLTDTPALYGQRLIHAGRKPVFVSDINDLIARLKNVSAAGLVLEIDKVMKAARKERDRLFNYTSNFPVIRTRTNPRHGFVAFLDPEDTFFQNLEAVAGQRCRNHERIKLELDCLLSREDDPSMAMTVEATIVDISQGGSYVRASQSFAQEQFLHLRIPHLSNSRPIYASVRWSRPDENLPGQCGMGLMFIDLAADQLEEIAELRFQVEPDSVTKSCPQ